MRMHKCSEHWNATFTSTQSHVCFGLSTSETLYYIKSTFIILINYLVAVDRETWSSQAAINRTTVDTDSFNRVLGGNIAVNAIFYQLSQLSKWNSTKISVLTCTTKVHNFICDIVIEMYEYTLVNFKAVFLRFVFRQLTRGTFSLSNDNSATNSLVVVFEIIGKPVKLYFM